VIDFTKFKELINRERDDGETLTNKPEFTVIGGHREAKAERIPIREPVWEEVEGFVVRIVETLMTLSEREKARVSQLVTDPGQAVIKDVAKLKPIQECLESILGEVVGKDATYVRKEMTPKQITKAAALFIRAVGYREISETFFDVWAMLKPQERKTKTGTFDPTAAQ
jgi:hypothetical protein